MENKKNTSETIQKILKGLELVSEKLIESKKKNNGDMVISEDGVIKRIKSTDL
jgi:hypothetical protein